jgi:hypothetical protein
MSTNSPPRGHDNHPINDKKVSFTLEALDPYLIPRVTRDTPFPIDEAPRICAPFITLFEQVRFLIMSVEDLQERALNQTLDTFHPTPPAVLHQIEATDNHSLQTFFSPSLKPPVPPPSLISSTTSYLRNVDT